jgi:hypothetical protein
MSEFRMAQTYRNQKREKEIAEIRNHSPIGARQRQLLMRPLVSAEALRRECPPRPYQDILIALEMNVKTKTLHRAKRLTGPHTDDFPIEVELVPAHDVIVCARCRKRVRRDDGVGVNVGYRHGDRLAEVCVRAVLLVGPYPRRTFSPSVCESGGKHGGLRQLRLTRWCVAVVAV